MKKALFLILAGIMAFSLTACGSEDTSSDNTPDTSVSETEEAPDITDLSLYVGSYQDSYSQRATAEVVEGEGDNCLLVTISWAQSAEVTNIWNMTCTLDEERGTLIYTDCEQTVTTAADDGSQNIEAVSGPRIGYFEVSAEKDKITMAWSGSADNDCKECVFEKIS